MSRCKQDRNCDARTQLHDYHACSDDIGVDSGHASEEKAIHWSKESYMLDTQTIESTIGAAHDLAHTFKRALDAQPTEGPLVVD